MPTTRTYRLGAKVAIVLVVVAALVAGLTPAAGVIINRGQDVAQGVIIDRTKRAAGVIIERGERGAPLAQGVIIGRYQR